jgi:hypothetical protein
VDGRGAVLTQTCITPGEPELGCMFTELIV